MAKIGEKELYDGVKQGAIVGVGYALISALASAVPMVKSVLDMLPPINLGPVTLDLKLIVIAIVAAIGGNYVVDMFK